MRLFFDLEMGRLVRRAGFSELLGTIELKRGDSAALEVVFVRNGLAAAIGADGTTPPVEMIFCIKGDISDTEPLALAAAWTYAEEGADPLALTPVWRAVLACDGAAMATLIGTASYKDAVAEFTFTDSAGGPNSSQTLACRIHADVWAGTEGTPLTLPGPEAWLGARGVRFDKAQTLTAEQRVIARANTGVVEAFVFDSAPDSSLSWYATLIPSVDFATNVPVDLSVPLRALSEEDGRPGFTAVTSAGEASLYWESGAWNLYMVDWSIVLTVTSDAISPVGLVFAVGETDGTGSIQITLEEAETFPAKIGDTASWPIGASFGYAFCVGQDPVVWQVMDSAWVASKIANGGLGIAQVSTLREDLDNRFGKDKWVAPTHGIGLKSPDGSRFRIEVANNGTISSAFVSDAVISSYGDATGITQAGEAKLQTLATSLGALYTTNLVDAGFYKESLLPVDAVSIPSLRGTGYLNSVGAPIRGKAGLIFSGTEAAWLKFSPQTGPRTLVLMCSNTTGYGKASLYNLLDSSFPAGTRGETFGFPGVGNQGLFGADSGAIGDSVSAGYTGISRSSYPTAYCLVHSFSGAADGTAGAIKHRNVGWPVGSMEAVAPYSVDMLVLGASGGSLTNQVPAPTNFCKCAVSCWMLFNKVLSEGEITTVVAALNVLHPKWVWLVEGDSISYFTSNTLSVMPEIYGANMYYISSAMGGETAANGVAQLGTANGLRAEYLTMGLPTAVDICFGANDISFGVSAATVHANLRTIWAYARTHNPSCVIVARTVTQAQSHVNGGYEPNRNALNALIRADEGVLYDALVDSAAWTEANKDPAVANAWADTRLFTDGVHPTAYTSTEIGKQILAAFQAHGIVLY